MPWSRRHGGKPRKEVASKSSLTTTGEKEISPQISSIGHKNIAVSEAGLLGERPPGWGGMGRLCNMAMVGSCAVA